MLLNILLIIYAVLFVASFIFLVSDPNFWQDMKDHTVLMIFTLPFILAFAPFFTPFYMSDGYKDRKMDKQFKRSIKELQTLIEESPNDE